MSLTHLDENKTGVSIALLTIYDMLKAIDKSMIIHDVQLEHKSGNFNRIRRN